MRRKAVKTVPVMARLWVEEWAWLEEMALGWGLSLSRALGRLVREARARTQRPGGLQPGSERSLSAAEAAARAKGWLAPEPEPEDLGEKGA